MSLRGPYISMALDVKGESTPGYSAKDIGALLDAVKITKIPLELNSWRFWQVSFFSKDYNIQQTTMTGDVKCAVHTDNHARVTKNKRKKLLETKKILWLNQ